MKTKYLLICLAVVLANCICLNVLWAAGKSKGGIPAAIADLQNRIDNIELTPGPPGPAGPVGPAGADGAAGSDGVDGLNGLSCWDLDADDVCTANEDANNDGFCDALDCQGSMLMTPQSTPLSPELGQMYYDDSEAICIYMSSGWVKIAGDGACGPCPSGQRFCKIADGAVLDTVTNLIWAATSTPNMTWSQAKNYCETFTGGGITGWRMPTRIELEQLHAAGVTSGIPHEYINIIDGPVGYSYVWGSDQQDSSYPMVRFQSGWDGTFWVPWPGYPRSALPVLDGN